MTDDAVSDASSGYFARILTTFAHYSHIYPFRLNMKKKLWLIHQHCTRVILDERGHHYWIVKELAQRGYEPVVFCSNFDHYSRKFVDESNPLFFERTLPCGAKCVFIRSNAYHNSGRDYARSLFLFYRNLMKVAKIYTTPPHPPRSSLPRAKSSQRSSASPASPKSATYGPKASLHTSRKSAISGTQNSSKITNVKYTNAQMRSS